MGERTNIQWCDTSWSPWEGCTKISPGCDHCYAESMNHWLRAGENWGPGAPRRLYSDAHWRKPIMWNSQGFFACQSCGWRGNVRAANPHMGAGAGCPACGGELLMARRSVFPSVCDPFDNEAPESERERFWDLIEATPNIDYLLLTKRIGNAKGMLRQQWLEPGQWPKHVRIGATIVNQEEAVRDITKLIELDCPNFLSLEPLLSAVDLTVEWFAVKLGGKYPFKGIPHEHRTLLIDLVDWVIVGGESGKQAREFQIEWARDIVRQCKNAGKPVLVKQLGAAPTWDGMAGPDEQWPSASRSTDTGRGVFQIHLADKKGGDIEEWPFDLRVREFPERRP